MAAGAGGRRVTAKIWLTAYSALGLHEATLGGYPVAQATLAGATSFMGRWLTSTDAMQDDATLDTRAFVLYVLSEMGSGDTARATELFDRHTLLTIEGRAFLLLALDNAGATQRDRVQTLASELTANAILSATGAHWEVAAPQPMTLGGATTRTTALVLRALVRVQPEHMLLPQTVRWLMLTRLNGSWETTQESAWSVLALTDYMLASGELDAEYRYEVALNDEVVVSEEVSQSTLTEATTLRVDIADLLMDEANRLIITRVPESGEGRLYYSAWLRYYQSVTTLGARNEGISVTRRYEAVDPDTLESTGSPISSAAVGEIVQVRLTVQAPNDLFFLTLEDPIPAGFEVLDPALLTTLLGVEGPGGERVDEAPRGNSWLHRWLFEAWSQQIIRDEKVVLFADRLARGTYEYTYFLRATVPGEFNVLPAVAYEQYQPEVFGRSEGSQFQIEP